MRNCSALGLLVSPDASVGSCVCAGGHAISQIALLLLPSSFRQLCGASRATSLPAPWSHLNVPDIFADGRCLGSAPNLRSLGGLASCGCDSFLPPKVVSKKITSSFCVFRTQFFFATAFARVRTQKGSADISGGNAPHVALGGLAPLQEDCQRPARVKVPTCLFFSIFCS